MYVHINQQYVLDRMRVVSIMLIIMSLNFPLEANCNALLVSNDGQLKC